MIYVTAFEYVRISNNKHSFILMSEWNLLWRCVFCELQSINLSQRRQIIDSWRRVSDHKRLWSTLLEVKDTFRGCLNCSWHRKDKELATSAVTSYMLYAQYLPLIIFNLGPQFHARNSSDFLYKYPCMKVEGCLARWVPQMRRENRRIRARAGGWWPEARGRDVRLLRLPSPARIMDREGGGNNEELPVEKISTMWSVLTRRH